MDWDQHKPPRIYQRWQPHVFSNALDNSVCYFIATVSRIEQMHSVAFVRFASVKSASFCPPVRSPLQKQQSLPLRPIIPLVARISDQNASGAPPMTVREKSRLDKFRQLLASPNTDLGELRPLRLLLLLPSHLCESGQA